MSILLAGSVIALGASGCLGDEADTEDDPEEGLESAALLVEDECLPSDVTWSPPTSETQPCTGPWTYNAYQTVTNRHSDCGPASCTLYRSCTRWLAQTPKKPTHTFTLDGINCRLVVGEGLICDPNLAVAQATCSDFRTTSATRSRRRWTSASPAPPWRPTSPRRRGPTSGSTPSSAA